MPAADTQFVYGWHAVETLLARNPGAITALQLAAGDEHRAAALETLAVAAGVPVERLPRRELDRRFPQTTHQGVVAHLRSAVSMRSEKELPALLDSLAAPAFLLVLDGVQDPHNLGACLRSADAAGVQAVIIPRDRAVGITAVVHKVASGAVQSVPVFAVTNLARTLRMLKEAGIWLYGASDTAEQDLYATDLRGPLALVLGGEGRGLRRLTAELCDFRIAIPMAGVVESLNVSAAAAVLLFEARRQRLEVREV